MTDKPPPEILISQSLRRREGEPELAHLTFLVYVMLAPRHRSNRRAGACTSVGESTVRKWNGRWEWERRLKNAGSEGDKGATALYAEFYHSHLDAEPLRAMERGKITRAPYPFDIPEASPEGTAARAQRPSSAQLADLRDAIRPPKAEPVEPEETPTAKRAAAVAARGDVMQRPETLELDAEEAEDRKATKEILNSLQKLLREAFKDPKKVKLGVADIERMMTLRERYKASQRVEIAEGPAVAETVAKSERVTRAHLNRTNVLDAVLADTSELMLILTTLRDAESNVVPLRVIREEG